MNILEEIQRHIDVIIEAKLPSDKALSALWGASKTKKTVPKGVKDELLKMNLVNKTGTVTKDGNVLLKSPQAVKKIKELAS